MTPDPASGALVLDARLRSSVAGVRALGRAGVEVVALGERRDAAGRWSRYAHARELAPGAAQDPGAYAAAVVAAAARRGPLVAYPGSEDGVDAVLAASQATPSVIAPWPVESLARLRVKPSLARVAAAVGVPTPQTVVESRVSELRRAPPEVPCAVKPVVQNGAVRSTLIARTAAELEGVLERFGDDALVLVQPVVPGRLVSLGVVLGRDGELLAAFQQVARRTWPAAAGSIALGVSVPADPALVEAATAVLREAGYWGLADVEFLADEEQFTLIDVNTRYFGCLGLALACGVNLPAAWRSAVLGFPAPVQPAAYPTGVTYRWLEADAMAALRGRPGVLLRAPRRPVVGAMWAADDPVPSLLMAAGAVPHRVRTRRQARQAAR